MYSDIIVFDITGHSSESDELLLSSSGSATACDACKAFCSFNVRFFLDWVFCSFPSFLLGLDLFSGYLLNLYSFPLH